MTDPIRGFYRRIRLRLRLAWLAETAQTYAPQIAFIVLALFVFDWLTGWFAAPRYSIIVVMSYAVTLIIGSLLLRIGEWDAARSAERGLGLPASLTTALEFNNEANEIHLRIQTRAREIAAGASPAQAIPIPMRRDKLRLLAYGAVLTIGFAILPALGGTPALSSDTASALGAEAQEVEKLAEAVRQADVATSEEIAEELEALAQRLREARSLEEGIDALDSTDKRLSARADPTFLAQKAAVQGLARDLVLRPLIDGAPLDAVSQLEELAAGLDDMSQPELRALQDRLADLAESQASGNPALASDLADASRALSDADLTAAGDALKRAASGQTSGMAEARDQQALNEVRRSLDAIEGRLAGSGSGGENGLGPGQGQGQGQGRDQGQGQGQNGQGSGGPSGVISGVRPGDGNASGQGGQGTVGAGTPGETGGAPQSSDIYDPVDRGNLSDLLQVNIEGGSADGDLVGRGEAPTERGQSIVPYARVLPEYLNEAADALGALRLPPSMKGIVQSYFDQLANEVR